MESVLDELARELEGKAIIGKVHSDQSALFKQFGVRGIPAFFLLRDGEIKQQFVGAQSKNTLKAALERHGPAGSRTVLFNVPSENRPLNDCDLISRENGLLLPFVACAAHTSAITGDTPWR
jgi:thioredoxin-like negative regulator of GroEL